MKIKKEYIEVKGVPSLVVVDSQTVDLLLGGRNYRLKKHQLEKLLNGGWVFQELAYLAQQESEAGQGVVVEDC